MRCPVQGLELELPLKSHRGAVAHDPVQEQCLAMKLDGHRLGVVWFGSPEFCKMFLDGCAATGRHEVATTMVVNPMTFGDARTFAKALSVSGVWVCKDEETKPWFHWCR